MTQPQNRIKTSQLVCRVITGLLVFPPLLIQSNAQEASELLADVSPGHALVSRVTTGGATVSNIAMSVTGRDQTRDEILNAPLKGRLSLALINRIEELPREKMRVDAGLETAAENEVDAAKLERKLADHWKELLVTLVAHHDKVALEQAELKVEGMLEVSEQIGYAMVVQEGYDIADNELPSMEARLQASEALVARYVRSVMNSRRTDEWWQDWRDAWNRGVTRVPQDIVGQWSIAEETGVNFAQATIADHRCTLIWQERAGGKVQKIDFDVMRADNERLFADKSDSGLRYQLRTENEHAPILSFDVPGRKADTVLKVQLRPDW